MQNENMSTRKALGRKKRSGRTAGQSARRRRQKLRRESTLETIDRLLLASVRTSLNGKETRITALAAIMYQLLQREFAGDVCAGRALLKYEELAKQGAGSRLEMEFVDSDYTRSLADDWPESQHG